ncbi:hypothetical protein TFLX_05225 [Thermoflexales bacterium]|nr:hypothetical protein TFLX_05225 [Thermoflexales bacterium]
MNEEDWADYFSRELDGLISQTEKDSTRSAPADFHEARQVATTLAQLNFSAESRQREKLRRRLLAQAHQSQEAQMKMLHWRHALTWSIIGTVTVLMLTLTLFYPGGVAAAAQNVYDALRSIVLGDYSRAMQTKPSAGNDPAPLLPDMWKIRTEIGNFAGNAPPGVEPLVRSVTTLEEAQALVNFHLTTPTYLPDGYVLREVKLAPIGGTHWVLSFYGGAVHDIIIVQMPGGPQPSPNPNEVHGVYDGIITTEPIEEIDFDGRTAAWIDGKALVWSVDNMTYEVGGVGLTPTEAKQIARSLR